jgi:uncharacterized protein (DUF1330 family)
MSQGAEMSETAAFPDLPKRVLSLVFAKIHDRERFAEYGARVGELMSAYGGARVALVAPDSVRLEGDWDADGVELAILEWPSVEAQMEFWNSVEYQALKQERVELVSMLSYCGEFLVLGPDPLTLGAGAPDQD